MNKTCNTLLPAGRSSVPANVLAASLLALAFTVADGPATAAAQEFTVPFEANQYILDQTNRYRKENGIPKLTMNHPANVAADQYAQFLAENKASGHEADGRTPGQRVTANKGKYCAVGENIHGSWHTPNQQSWQDAAAGAIQGWRNSAPHAENMRRDWNKMGIGVHGWKHGDEWHYRFVQVFVKTNC